MGTCPSLCGGGSLAQREDERKQLHADLEERATQHEKKQAILRNKVTLAAQKCEQIHSGFARQQQRGQKPSPQGIAQYRVAKKRLIALQTELNTANLILTYQQTMQTTISRQSELKQNAELIQRVAQFTKKHKGTAISEGNMDLALEQIGEMGEDQSEMLAKMSQFAEEHNQLIEGNGPENIEFDLDAEAAWLSGQTQFSDAAENLDAQFASNANAQALDLHAPLMAREVDSITYQVDEMSNEQSSYASGQHPLASFGQMII